ncbi:MAG: CRTAC1 family protein [Gammaproteobacteria bacterium]|nr:CRTAC1 family protein [Gammaproteobacteria bacterium]
MAAAPDARSGDARIARAFRWSLFVIAIVATVAAALWWSARQAHEPERSVEAMIPAPVQSTPLPTAVGAPPAIPFTDITAAAGVEFVHVNGAYGDKLIPETMGSGLAFFDYDNDGDPDLYLVNSRWWPERADGRTSTGRLYRNDGDGRFSDVTREVGLEYDLYGMGVAVGDIDNDGWQDLYLSNLGSNLLLRNDHGRFVDVTAAAAVAGNPDDWSTGTAFVDIDNDGDLDLFVGNYITWSPAIDREIDFRLAGLGRAYGGPEHHAGALNRLYRNDGDGHFSDVSQASGIALSEGVDHHAAGKALAVAIDDIDSDGWSDIVVANDTTRNFLYRNLGDGRFEEIGLLEGIAYDREGRATSGMGLDIARFRNDADIGIAIGNFANEMSSLYVTADGRGPFVDEAVLEGFGPDSRLALTFAVLFFDADLDGRPDLFQANGHLENDINRVHPSQTYAQPAQLFWNCGTDCAQRFQLLDSTGDLRQPVVGRGAGYADIDGDGDLDLAIVQNGGRAVLLRNDQHTGHHWLRVKLVGSQANRDAVGARVELRAGDVVQVRYVSTSRGYLSQVERTLTFGLGGATAIHALTVTWPGGQTQQVAVNGVDREITVEQMAMP